MTDQEYEAKREQERKDIRVQAEHLKALCHEVAVYLPGDWVTVEPDEEEEIRAGGPGLARADYPGRYVKQADGHGLINICIGGYGHRGRIVCRASWNGLWEFISYNDRCPEITVVDTTPGAKVAKAIANRLLPKYLPLLAEAVRRKAAHDDTAAKVAKAAEDLALATGGKVGQDRKSAYPGDMVYLSGLGWLIVCCYDVETTVGFEQRVSTTAEKAIRIVKILQEG